MRPEIVKTCPLCGGQAEAIVTEGISYPLAEYKCVSCGAAGPRQGGINRFVAMRCARLAFDEWAEAVQATKESQESKVVQGC